jgi:uracil phosphoribosyltransferase
MKAHSDFPNLFVSDHPLVQHKLSHMRDVKTTKSQFKTFLHDISLLLGYEVTRTFKTAQQTITTPICDASFPVLRNKDPILVPILRAGLGMLEGLETLMPQSQVGHVGLYRDEETKEPVEYLLRLPPMEGRDVIAVDPMLATGNSAKYAIDLLIREGADPDRIRFMALLAAPEGVEVLHKAYPNIPIYLAGLDEKLNEKAYIVPGLGDAGDRLFGT